MMIGVEDGHIDPQVVYSLPGRDRKRPITARTRPPLGKCIVRQVLRNNCHPAPGHVPEHILLDFIELVKENELNVEVALTERAKEYRNPAAFKGRNMIVGGGVAQGGFPEDPAVSG